ncbi:MAG: MFS transporter [Acidobacteria bacterium]|nr:MFS transporter [Acidobacteriota bacterium]
MLVRKLLSVFASFLIMLCLGGVYAWSIVAPELMKKHNFTAAQSQFIMGLLIGILPVVMIFAGKIEIKHGTKILGFISAVVFAFGYLISGFSKGNFYLVLLGNGLLAGVASAFGYLASLTTPVKCFPQKKGLMTGIAVSGFGLASMVLSYFVNFLLKSGKDILEIFNIVGVSYGLIILFASFLIYAPNQNESNKAGIKTANFFKSFSLYRLILGFFFGTFAGLLIVGSLKPIGVEKSIDNETIVLSVSVFAIANFLGRITWGFISDYLGASLTIFIALFSQSISIMLLGMMSFSPLSFIAISIWIGFSFGGNFVLFAKETSDIYGVENLGSVYPYVSFGYALGGIFGPLTGGIIFDKFGNYFYAILLASFISLVGALIFLVKYFVSAISKYKI